VNKDLGSEFDAALPYEKLTQNNKWRRIVFNVQ
jgi:hypothetical protein